MADSFSGTLENWQSIRLRLRSEIATHVSEIKAQPAWTQIEKLYRALGTIEELAETPKTTLADLFGFADTGSNVTVRQGEFIGMDALDAAKAYLEKKQAEAASLDEITDALLKGGANTVNRDVLAKSLARSTWDVVKAPGQELYQLQVCATRQTRKQEKVLGKRPNGGSPLKALVVTERTPMTARFLCKAETPRLCRVEAIPIGGALCTSQSSADSRGW